VSTPEATGLNRWRVFPWDERAAPGSRFSPSFVPAPTGRGRFDLPPVLSNILYLADSPDHAVGETLQPWRGQGIGAPHLRRAGFPLALVQVTTTPGLESDLVDLCDPRVLRARDIAPDQTTSRYREHTQPLARQVWDTGASGLRWWSSFWGDWHTVVLFTARTGGRIDFGDPIPLSPSDPAVVRAAYLMGIRIVE
jgi:hypothetical protein